MARAVESIVWWAVLVGVWLCTLSTVTTQELVLAAVAAVPCALVATALRAAYQGRWKPTRAWSLPMRIVRECASLFSRASLRKIPVDTARKAVKTVVVSASPGTVVLDDKDDELLVHSLGRR